MIKSPDIVLTYKQYFESVDNQNSFKNNLFIRGVTGVQIATSIEANKNDNQKIKNDNQQLIDKNIKPFFIKNTLLNDKNTATLFSCVEEYFNKGFRDLLLIKSVSNLLHQYYLEKERKFKNQIISCLYFQAKTLSSYPFPYTKNDALKKYDELLGYLSYLHKCKNEVTNNYLLTSIIEAMKLEVSYESCSISKMTALYNLAEKYYSDPIVCEKITNNNRIQNLKDEANKAYAKIIYHQYNTPIKENELKKIYDFLESMALKQYLNSNEKIIHEYNFTLIKVLRKKILKEEIMEVFKQILKIEILSSNYKFQKQIFLEILPQIRHFTDDKDLLLKSFIKIRDFIKNTDYLDLDYQSEFLIYENVVPLLKTLYEDKDYLNYLYELLCGHSIHSAVQSLVKAEITKSIAQTVLDINPSLFNGYNKYKTKDVMNHKQEIINDLFLCGLIHDLGKTSFIYDINDFLRDNTPLEKIMIGQHVENSKYIADNIEKTVFYDVIMGHHKSYDGKNGYPLTFDNKRSSFKIAIDIISLANSIFKSRDQLIQEYNTITTEHIIIYLKKLSPHHFNKKVINIILGNKLLLSRIEYLLTSGYSSIVQKTCEIIINKKEN